MYGQYKWTEAQLNPVVSMISLISTLPCFICAIFRDRVVEYTPAVISSFLAFRVVISNSTATVFKLCLGSSPSRSSYEAKASAKVAVNSCIICSAS